MTHANQVPLRLAIVDDHRMLLDALTHWVRTADADIVVAAAVTGWAELLAHPHFPFDVVLLDLDLRDDLDLRMKLRLLRTTGAKTIVISTHARRSVIVDALAAGASGYLVKSEDTATIIQAITAAASGSQFSTARLDGILSTAVEPGLSDQERRVVALYSAGRPMKQVAQNLNISVETARAYLRRARAKYKAAGIDVSGRLSLRSRAIDDDIIDHSTL